jgi:hypothetical protein
LTRICSVEYIRTVESVFEIIAEPNRRAILSLQVSSQPSVGEIERQRADAPKMLAYNGVTTICVGNWKPLVAARA